MNKIWAIFLAFWFALAEVSAQLPAGATAPDFTVQDINGQVHHLYDVLEADKIVLLEISATWCAPCWAYHQTGALQDFYEAHGPAGDNKARVYWIEGDPNTNISCIYGQPGCNEASAGNYTQGATYPIINSSTIANSFQINYYPSVFVICPNKRVYEVDPLSATGLWEEAQVCPVAFGENNAGIFAHDPGYGLPEICDQVELAPSFLLTNLGTTPLTSANILVRWNNQNVQTIEWAGNLATYEEAAINFAELSVDAAGELNTIVTSINNNAGDADFSNNYKNNFYQNSKHFEHTQILLKIRTDDYGFETYWELWDEFGNVLDKGGNKIIGINGGGAFPLGVDHGPGSYPSNTLIKDTLILPTGGCYSIHFVDAYGDGMCCNYGNGYYRLYDINDPVNPIINVGQYKDYDRHAFSAGLVSSNVATPFAPILLKLFPNPAQDRLFVEADFSSRAPFRFQVLNALGQMVLDGDSGKVDFSENGIEIQLSGIANGMYYFSLEVEGQQRVITRKFVVQH